jgi:hypothetical protein
MRLALFLEESITNRRRCFVTKPLHPLWEFPTQVTPALRSPASPSPFPQDGLPGHRYTARSRFALWRGRRPFWGSVLLFFAGILVLWEPLLLIHLIFVPGTTIWSTLLVGTLLLALSLLQLFAPTHTLLAGIIGLVLSLSALFTVFGGFLLGTLCGCTGAALSLAWVASNHRRLLFAGIQIVNLSLLIFVLAFFLHGALSMAMALPLPLTITARSIRGSNFHLYPGTASDHTTPVAIAQFDATVTDLTISKNFSLPLVGNVSIQLASSGPQPVTARNLTIDIEALNADDAAFTDLSLNSGSTDFDLQSSTIDLEDITITLPYLSTSNVTLPGLSLSVTRR